VSDRGYTTLSDSFVNNLASNPGTSNMVSKANTGSLKTQMSDTIKAAPGVREGLTKAVGPQLGGIVAGLL
jgi:hypothetical protein